MAKIRRKRSLTVIVRGDLLEEVRYYRKYFWILLMAALVSSSWEIAKVNAQLNPAGFAVGTVVDIVELRDGIVLCAGNKGARPCSSEYSPDILGVYAVNSAVYLDITTAYPNSQPSIRSGNANVKVSAVNGAVKMGDYITTSNSPGVGMKATKSGNVLGVAMSEFSPARSQDVGTVLVAVGIRPVIIATSARTNVLETLKQGLLAPTLTPLASLRYLLAILIALVSLVIGLIYFGRSGKSSVEAMGRNPMAVKIITVGMLLNMLFTMIIVGSGLLVAYLVLVL